MAGRRVQGNPQPATCDLQPATCNLQPATCNYIFRRNMKKFVSVRTKLTANTMITISAIFIIVLSVVTVINIRSVNQSIVRSERNIRNSLTVKGNTLINNNSMAMTGMAADNAVTAVRNLVSSAIKDDPDIVFGIYMDTDHIAWAYSTPENPSGVPQNNAPLEDELSEWAGSLKKPESRIHKHQGKEVIEFAGPVFFDRQILGFIRYGISTESMHQLLRETLADGIRTRNYMIAVLLCLGIGSLAVSYFIVRRLSARITRPIDSLVKSAMTIASGNYDVPVTSDSNDELGLLVKDVDKMRKAIRELTENLKEQERLKSEMELARKIQTVLLPKHPEISGYEIAVSMDPAEEVGGDYYDVISVGGFDWIVIGDVSGHGVTAGLVMMMVQTAIHTVLIQNPQVPPSELLWVINRVIYENLVKMDESKHMTIVVLACGKNGFFRFSGLHDDMLLRRAVTRKVETIKTDGMWIGLEADISEMLSVDEFRMEKGDCLVLFSDGIIEAWGKDGKMFETERLIKVIEKFGDRSVSELHDAVLDALKDYEKSDDVTLLVMKRV